MTNNQNKEEVDLHVVFSIVKDVSIKLYGYVLHFLFVAKKRWSLISFFLLIGGGLGIGSYFLTKNTYIATTTLSSNVLSNDYCADLIHNLELIVEDNTPKLLAQKLKIDTTAAKEIKRIEFSNYDEKLYEKYKNKDTIVLGLPFKIKLFASTNTVFDTLQKAFVDYLENNEYSLKRKEIKKQNNLLMHQKLNTEIQELDSLKNLVSNNLLPKTSNTGFIFGQPLDPVNVYKEGINLFRNSLQINEELALADNIEVISAFSPRAKPDTPVFGKSIIKGLYLGLCLGLLSTFVLEMRKKV